MIVISPSKLHLGHI